jgi:hypothetical protein
MSLLGASPESCGPRNVTMASCGVGSLLQHAWMPTSKRDGAIRTVGGAHPTVAIAAGTAGERRTASLTLAAVIQRSRFHTRSRGRPRRCT